MKKGKIWKEEKVRWRINKKVLQWPIGRLDKIGQILHWILYLALLSVCKMALRRSVLFMVQTHKEDQRRMKNSEFRGVFSFYKTAASQTWAVMAFLRALNSLSWLSRPFHQWFGWWDEMRGGWKASHTLSTQADVILQTTERWLKLAELSLSSHLPFHSLSVFEISCKICKLKFSFLKWTE